MKIFQYYLLGFLFTISVNNLFSKEGYNLQFGQISTKNGLSQNTVRSILVDRLGFIWAGTLDGLNRYDGYTIITYKPELGNSRSLTDHRIKDVFQDKDGYLWIKTYKNEFCCYDPVADSFVNYLPETISQELLYTDYYETLNGDIWLWGNINGAIQLKKHGNKIEPALISIEIAPENKRSSIFFFEDSQSTVWIGGDLGLFKIEGGKTENLFRDKYSFVKAVELNGRIYFATKESYIIEYDLKKKSFTEIKNTIFNDAFSDIACLSDQDLLISTRSSGVISFNIDSKLFYKPDWAKDADLRGDIAFIVDGKKGIWMYNHTGIVWFYNQVKGRVKKMELIPSHIAQMIDFERYVVFTDSKGLIWITTYGNGLFCFDTETEVLNHYKYKANENSPASDYLLSITEDNYGNIWVGSEYAGIIKVIKSNYEVRVIRPEQETSIGKNNNVRTIYKDNNNTLWVGTKNGSLYTYDERLEKQQCFFKDINPYTLTEDANGNLWVGTKGKGLYIINKAACTQIAHYTRNNGNGINNNTIFSILKDSKDRMWIGSFGGGLNLAEQTPNGLVFKTFFSNDGNRSYIRYVFQDSKGIIWLGTSDGIICFDPDKLLKESKAFTSYKMDIGNEKGLNCNDIKTIYEDKEGTIWIGTAGGGINKFVPATVGQKEHFVSYTTKNGLSGDVISGIMEDNIGNLWISTESGISKFDKSADSFISYNFSEKTYQNHFNENANIYMHDGNMLWGSLDGLLVFNPESFITDPHIPPVILTNFFIYDQTIKAGEKGSPLNRSISYTNELTLNHKQNTFTLEFASLELMDPSKSKYMYLLENYDKQWNTISLSNTATYRNLPHGKYVFKIRGTNNDGVWNDKITQITIIITPPFWKTWYAYTFYGLLFLLILFIIIKLIIRFNVLNNNIKVEKELTNYKLRFFTNISHEFRTPLTLIQGAVENLDGQHNVSDETKKQVKVLSRNSAILSRLIDQLLEFRKLQNNVLTLDLEDTDIIDFSKDIYNNFQEIATQKNIQYLFENEVDTYHMYIDRRKVDKILYNLLSNAFKFVKKGGKIELSVSLNKEDQTCLIKVKDDGVGIDKEKQHLLFSRFMQINFSSSGTGVGLSLVKEFVDAHKGKIWYENNVGGGAIFNVELSTNTEIYKGENFITGSRKDVLHEDSDMKEIDLSEKIESIQLPEIEDTTLSNYKMLIVDDNDDIRNFLVDEFSKYFMVDVAENGAEGLQKAIEINPDMIICDVMMPEMNGFEVTRQLKEDFQTCHIPIILLTAHSSIEHQVEGIQSGADAYVMKPFSLKFLVTRVFKLIEQREQLKKRFSNEYVLDGNLITKTDKDREFYNLIDEILEEHLADSQFSVDKFAELSKQKRTIFYKKIKGITGLSPNELIKAKRLKRAAELLLQGDLTVSEIAYKVGFEDPFYFSKCFKAQYNCSPSKYGQLSSNENGNTP